MVATRLTAVLTGLGGVGKTQLAAHFARQQWAAGEVDLLVWVSATSRERIVAGYADAAAAVVGAGSDAERAAQRLLDWLEDTGRRWLVVLDDVVDPADVRGLWPPHAHGRTVVTTRRRDAVLSESGRATIDVGTFTPAAAVEYLHHRLGGDERLLDHAGELAADLGFLPLALAQAASYLRDRRLTCAQYRSRFADRRRRLTDLMPESGAMPDEHRATVAVTWSVSVDLADTLNPTGLSRPLMDLASMLDPNGIPTTVLTCPPALAYLARSRTAGDAMPDADLAVDGLWCLHRLSLALVAAWAEPERDPLLAQQLRANAIALRATAGDTLFHPHAHPVLFRVGESTGQAGLITAARDYFESLHADCRRILGPDHPDAFTARRHEARWRGTAGDPTEAANSLADLVRDYQRTFGPDHPDTLTARNHMARWQGGAGDPAGAAATLADPLHDVQRVHGPDHHDTLTTRHILARWRGTAGDPTGAVAALAELLEDYLRVLGPDHPDTMAARHNLAYWSGEAGDPAGAATAFADLLPDYIHLFGADHPDTLMTRHHHLHWRAASGDAASAVTGYQTLLADYRRVLGPDHPDTHVVIQSLTRWQDVTQ